MWSLTAINKNGISNMETITVTKLVNDIQKEPACRSQDEYERDRETDRDITK